MSLINVCKFVCLDNDEEARVMPSDSSTDIVEFYGVMTLEEVIQRGFLDSLEKNGSKYDEPNYDELPDRFEDAVSELENDDHYEIMLDEKTGILFEVLSGGHGRRDFKWLVRSVKENTITDGIKSDAIIKEEVFEDSNIGNNKFMQYMKDNGLVDTIKLGMVIKMAQVNDTDFSFRVSDNVRIDFKVENNNSILNNKAYTVSELPKEIRDIIGGASKALIIPIEEVKKPNEIAFNPMIRLKICDVLGDDNRLVMTLDIIVDGIRHLDFMVQSGEVISLENVLAYKYILKDLKDAILTHKDIIRNHELFMEMRDMLSKTELEHIVMSKLPSVLDGKINWTECDNDGTITSLFEYNITYKDDEYVIGEVEWYDGVETYIKACEKNTGFIWFKPIEDNFYVYMQNYDKECRTSYESMINSCFSMGVPDEFMDGAGKIIKQMYESNLINYVSNSEDFAVTVTEKVNGEYTTINKRKEWLGY